MDTEAADRDIRARLAADDASALDMIWNLYAADLLGYLAAVLCSRHEAEDVLQDLFLAIVHKRHAVSRARRLRPYLFRMAHNAAVTRIRRRALTRQRLHDAADWLELRQKEDAPDDRSKQLISALEALPEEQRTVIVLKHYREKTFREIGEILDISENTAGSRYRYGIEKLRILMREAPQ